MADPKWLHPEAIEREYAKGLKQYARRCQRAVNELLMPEVPRLVEMAGMRGDALAEGEEDDEGTWADWLNEILGGVLALLLGRRDRSALEGMAGATGAGDQVFEGMPGPASAADVGVAEFGERVSRFNLRQFVKLVRGVYGEPYGKAEGLNALMRAWELENLKLIRSIPEQYVDQLQGTIIRAINEGQSATALRDTIRATYDKPVKRAQLIASDQIGKLNGRLTQYRQQNIGIKEYYWRGVLDWRERAHHRRRERDTFRWSKPPWDGHPGQPIHCRCWASPKWPPRDEVTLQ